MPNKEKSLLIRLFILAAVLLVAFALRVHNLSALPPGLSGDEGINASDAMRVSLSYRPIFFSQNFGREPLYIYSMAGLFRLIGTSTFSTRYITVLYSLIGLALIYSLVRYLWCWKTAVITVAFISISFWPLFISRVGLRAITMLPLQALTIYALLRGLEKRSWPWLIVSGLSLGLLFYTYVPGRIFIVVLAVWILFVAVANRGRPLPLIGSWPRLLFVGALALIIMIPLAQFMRSQPEQANLRLEEVGDSLETLKQGDPAPALNGLWLTAKMFSLRGDTYLRYNIPERPLFDWAIAVLFYIGLFLSVRFLREPRYSLLLVWLFLMLIPTALSDRTPSFLRSVGALIPIYILPALALTAVYRQIIKRNKKFGYLVGLSFIAVIILVHAYSSARAYFWEWPKIEEVGRVYGGRIARLANALDDMLPLPEGSETMVTCYYATHVCQDMIRLQSRYQGPIRPFAGYAGLVIPAPTNDMGDLVYLFGHALPPPQAIEQALAPAARVHWQSSPSGTPETAVYRLVAEVRQTENWTAGTELSGRFHKDGLYLNITAANVPAAASRGSKAEVALSWQIPPDYAWDGGQTPSWTLSLTDESGNELSRKSDIFPYEIQEWRQGDIVVQSILLPIPGDAAPGDLFPRLQIGRPDGEFLYQSDDGETRRYLSLPPIEATGTAFATAPVEMSYFGLEGELGLIETAVAKKIAPGEPLTTVWRWHVAAPPPVDYALNFRLCEGECNDESVFETVLPIWPERYPTSQWKAGESLRLFLSPAIPASLPNGSYRLDVTLVYADGRPLQTILSQAIDVDGRPHSFQIPEIETPINRQLSDGVKLLGYNLQAGIDSLQTGDSFDITVYWQAETTPGKGYTAFVHFYDPTGRLVGQDDRFPCDGLCPTFTWLPGEVISDKYRIVVDLSGEPGDYSFGFGMYDSETFQRLPVPETSDNVVITPAFLVN